MQTASSKIWTRVTNYIFYENNRYTKRTSLLETLYVLGFFLYIHDGVYLLIKLRVILRLENGTKSNEYIGCYTCSI